MSDGPICFMHVQKTGGSSVRAMLEAALPAGSLAPRRMDPANFASFDDFDGLSPEARAVVAVGEAERGELARFRAVCGHLSLSTLTAVAPLDRIATVLREPRARLLSYYLHLRFSTSLRTIWAHYGAHRSAEGSLAALLSDARMATVTDNRVCRMLLHGDPRIRDGAFIDKDDLGPLAEEAWERLDRFGFVGLVEKPEAAWRGVGELFGVELKQVRANVTGANGIAPGMLPVPPFGGAETLDLLEQRTAADAILYDRLVTREGGHDDPRRFADAGFAQALVRFGSLTSDARLELDAERRALAETRSYLHDSTQEVERAQATLEEVRRSRSWRYTAPLRRTGRRARPAGRRAAGR